MCKSVTGKHRQAGMTLLEVLVAFSILALSLGTLFSLYAQGPRATALAAETSNAVLLGESLLLSFIHGDGPARGSNGKYQWDITEQEYHATEALTSTPDGPQLRQYTIQVRWRGERQQQIELGTMRVRQQ